MEDSFKNPEDWLEERNLGQAIVATKEVLLKNPDDTGMRFLLFELLAMDHNISEAENELREVKKRDPEFSESGFELLTGILQAENKRSLFFAEGGMVGFLQEPPLYIYEFAKIIFSLSKFKLDIGKEPIITNAGDSDPKIKEIEKRIQKASSLRAKIPGTLDGENFEMISDADDFLAPFLEAFLPNHYLWLPWEQIKSISFPVSEGGTDTIWKPATIEFKNKIPQKYFWIPVFYPRAKNAPDSYKLGDMTGFYYLTEGGPKIGFGQRDLQIGNTLIGIRQISSIHFQKTGLLKKMKAWFS